MGASTTKVIGDDQIYIVRFSYMRNTYLFVISTSTNENIYTEAISPPSDRFPRTLRLLSGDPDPGGRTLLFLESSARNLMR